MPGSLHAQSQKCILHNNPNIIPKPMHRLEYHTNKVDHNTKQREAKHTKDSEHWLIQTPTSNCYTVLLEEESVDQQHKAGPENMPKPLPIYKTDVNKISHHSCNC
jgi:hypothetical protein